MEVRSHHPLEHHHLALPEAGRQVNFPSIPGSAPGPWKREQERALRSAVRQAVTAETGRCKEPPFTSNEAADICVDEICSNMTEEEGMPDIEGYTDLADLPGTGAGERTDI